MAEKEAQLKGLESAHAVLTANAGTFPTTVSRASLVRAPRPASGRPVGPTPHRSAAPRPLSLKARSGAVRLVGPAR